MTDKQSITHETVLSWSVDRQYRWCEITLLRVIQEVVAELPGIPDFNRKFCRNADTLDKAVQAVSVWTVANRVEGILFAALGLIAAAESVRTVKEKRDICKQVSHILLTAAIECPENIVAKVNQIGIDAAEQTAFLRDTRSFKMTDNTEDDEHGEPILTPSQTQLVMQKYTCSAKCLTGIEEILRQAYKHPATKLDEIQELMSYTDCELGKISANYEGEE